MTPTPRIFLVERTRDFRRALRLLLSSVDAQIFEYDSIVEFQQALANAPSSFLSSGVPSGCLVLGLHPDDVEGRTWLRNWPPRKMALQAVILADLTETRDLALAIEDSSSIQWLELSVDGDVFCAAVRKALSQLSDSALREFERREARAHYQTLSPREREVMELLACGKTPKMIALSLGTSHNTVRVQRAAVMSKMRVTNMAELANAFHLLES